MAKSTGLARDVGRFVLLSVLPILLGAVASAVGVVTQIWLDQAIALRAVAIVAGVVTAALLVVKAAVEFDWGRSKDKVRYSSFMELHNRLSSVLALVDEMAREDQQQLRADRTRWVKQVADKGASALVAMVPDSRDSRAAVYELGPATSGPATLRPIGQFGRRDVPRTFTEGTDEGDEVFRYLTQSPVSERYPDVKKKAPAHFRGDPSRYRTFIRAPIYSEGVVYGMLVVDAPKRRSLTEGDKDVADLVAAVLAIGFSVAAN